MRRPKSIPRRLQTCIAKQTTRRNQSRRKGMRPRRATIEIAKPWSKRETQAKLPRSSCNGWESRMLLAGLLGYSARRQDEQFRLVQNRRCRFYSVGESLFCTAATVCIGRRPA